MLRKQIITGALATALALAPVAVADAKKGFKPPKGPFFAVSGRVDRRSVLKTRCPIASALRATSIETTTTTYSYAFSGNSPKGRDLGSVRSKGETTYLFVREVEGESEYVKPTTIGPSRRPLGAQESTFSSAVRRVQGRKGDELAIDFGSLAGGLSHRMSVPAPKKGKPVTHLVNPDPITRRDPRPAPGCTHSEEITITGTITVDQV